MAILREDYHYDYPFIHWAFALSCLALVATTIWMIWDDYTSQWRTLQEKARTVQYLTRKQEVKKEQEQIGQALSELRKELENTRTEISKKEGTPVEKLLDRLKQYKDRHAKREASVAAAKSILREFESKQQLYLRDHAEPKETLQDKIRKQKKAVDRKINEEEEWQEKVNELQEKVQPVLELQRAIESREKKRAKLKSELAALNMEDVTTTVRNLPILNYASPTIKPQQIVLNHIKDNYNYTKIRKVDRCQTCHLMIDKPGFESPSDLEPFYKKEGIGRETLSSLQARKKKKRENGADEKTIDKIDRKITSIQRQRESYFTVFRTHPKLDLFLGATSPHPVQDYGCTVCHKGRGREMNFARAAHTPNSEEEKAYWKKKWNWEKQEHWHKPMKPMKYIESSCHKCHKKQELTPFAEDLNRGEKLVRRKGCYGCHQIEGLNDLPKPGPSLRNIKTKLDRDWVYKWLREPSAFKHSRMPDFYGLTNDSAEGLGLTSEQVKQSAADQFPAFNKVEMLAIREYLWAKSESPDQEEWESLPEDLTGDPDRGKKLFRKRGCKGCHTIGKDFAYSNSEENWPRGFGFDLGGVAAKASGQTEKFKEWLYNWIRDPRRYDRHARMPDLHLSKQTSLDISAYIMEATPFNELRNPEEFHMDQAKTDELDKTGEDIPTPEDLEASIDKLIIKQLTVNQPRKIAESALKLLEGKDVPGETAERILKRFPDVKSLRESYKDPYDRELIWLGERMIRARGCAGCHEIKGLENAGKVGAALTGSSSVGNKPLFMFSFGNLDKHKLGEGSRLKKRLKEKGWLLEHNRWSWMRQKLAHPRSFDFGTPNISYRAKLKMPKYEMSDEDRKAIVNFLMGLTNRELPPRLKVNPTGEQKIHEEAKRIISSNNCAGCHRVGTQLRDIELKKPGEELSQSAFLSSDVGEQWQQNKDMWLGGYLLLNPDSGETSFRLHLTPQDRETLNKRGVKIMGEKGAYLSGALISKILSNGFNRIPVQSYSHGAIQRLGALSTAASPPDLKLVGNKIKSDWLFSFLKNPQDNKWRRGLPVHMPNYHFTDREVRILSEFFYNRNDASYPYTSKKTLSLTEEERKQAIDTINGKCITCHGVYNEGQPTPALYKTRHRTKRGWLLPQPEGMGWLERPKELEPGTNMIGRVSEPEIQRTLMKYLMQLTEEEYRAEFKTEE